MKKIEICKGCYLKNPCSPYRCIIDGCALFKKVNIERCPCQTCLLKGMCTCFCVLFLEFVYEGICTEFKGNPKMLMKYNFVRYGLTDPCERGPLLEYLQFDNAIQNYRLAVVNYGQ